MARPEKWQCIKSVSTVASKGQAVSQNLSPTAPFGCTKYVWHSSMIAQRLLGGYQA